MELNFKEIRLGIENIDRISELPDSILSIILCKLATKYAVGTSILSTRWKNLFPFCFMPVKIALDDSLFLNPNRGDNNNYNSTPSVSFSNFVDKLFNVTLADVNYVEEIILHCNKEYGEDKVVSWANTALRLNVRHLDLYFLHSESNAWFDCLNGCTTLVTLHLSVLSVFNVPDDFSLPNLKNLEFVKFIYGYEDNPINALIQGCPALECLDLYQRNLESPHDICIRCPLLKKLVIKGGGELFINQLTLDAPNLQEFIYKGVRADFYDVCELNSLHTADFAIRFEEGLRESDDDIIHYSNSTAMIVSRCPSTIRLYLSDCAIDALHSSSMQLPVFHNLMWLTLGYLHWSILAHLLQIAPNLEQLTIEEGIQENEVEFQNLMHLLPTPPECLVLCLKKIEFGVFEGQENEIKIVEYFLKYGGVLQNLILHCIPCTDMSTLTRLLLLPRLSKTCKIDCILK